eukprot:TRINITY_DN13450_c0_g4_i2.p1 TRINITY_DN13450_c0_g4~~TRINITY_DN13450_c0_g4_i2.p1  ORF type:complete len:341 (+),score=84.40 TRINITY_DN13450_c0_g4_i2:58-1023(+)
MNATDTHANSSDTTTDINPSDAHPANDSVTNNLHMVSNPAKENAVNNTKFNTNLDTKLDNNSTITQKYGNKEVDEDDDEPLPLPISTLGCARLQGPFVMTSKEKERYLEAFSLNSVNAHLHTPLPSNKIRTNAKLKSYYQLSKKTKVGSKQFTPVPLRHSLVDDIENYERMKRLNSTGERLQVLRSAIQGWGVYAKQWIRKGEIIIEYVGELIDTALADKRESYYNQHGIGCYMFRIPDEDSIVDATLKGNMARFINHSCDPNAKTDHIYYNNQTKIVIYARRDIRPGEEISYDYLFAIDEGDKVPCTCGASKCKGFMNVA